MINQTNLLDINFEGSEELNFSEFLVFVIEATSRGEILAVEPAEISQ